MADAGGIFSCLLNLGIALGRSGQIATARERLDQALDAARALGHVAAAGADKGYLFRFSAGLQFVVYPELVAYSNDIDFQSD